MVKKPVCRQGRLHKSYAYYNQDPTADLGLLIINYTKQSEV